MLDHIHKDSNVYPKRFVDNFREHLQRVTQENQLMVFTCDDKLVGMCSWIFTDEYRKQFIYKTRWQFPEDISKGDILYITMCVLTKGCNVLKIKKLFEDIGMRSKINSVYWNNVKRGKTFKRRIV